MVHQVRWRGPISDQPPFDDGGIVVRNGPDTFDVIDAAALLALGAGQPGQIIRADSTSPIGFSWVYPDVDDAELWQPNTPYTADQIFSFSTANTDAQSIGGVDLEPGKTYLGKYATAKTSSGTLTNAEIALIEIVSGGNDGILYFGGWVLAEEYPVCLLYTSPSPRD